MRRHEEWAQRKIMGSMIPSPYGGFTDVGLVEWSILIPFQKRRRVRLPNAGAGREGLKTDQVEVCIHQIKLPASVCLRVLLASQQLGSASLRVGVVRQSIKT
jgi:hypothetical protein